MRTIDQMVQQEVNCCLSYLVSTLAKAYHANPPARFANGVSEDGREAQSLFEQAFELACPVADFEEAAIQAGWEPFTDKFGVACWRDTKDGQTWASSAEDLCAEFDIEPYDREVFEHWAVSQWLADKLREEGEKVDDDFGGLCVWARTTTGQGIASDSVIERIYSKLMKPEAA